MNVKAFQEEVRKIFDHCKKQNNLQSLISVGIQLNSGAMLLPLGDLYAENIPIINNLMEWRKKAEYAYPSKFAITFDGTKKWFQSQVIKNQNRLLFIIVDELLLPIGHIGFVLSDEFHTLEIDNVLRGNEQRKGVMTESLNALINWAYEVLFPEKINLKVLATNINAVSFYETNNFSLEKKIPLKKIGTTNEWNLIPTDDKMIDNYFNVMKYEGGSRFKNDELVLTAGPSISPMEKTFCADAVATGWNSNWNGYLKKLETFFYEYLGMKYCLPTSSCTGALHLALLALNIGKGDEVLVPDITWVASAQVINYVGATAIFVDVDLDTWNMNIDDLKSKITSKAKAIIPVHLYGCPAKMDEISSIAKMNSLFIIEDAAPALGAKVKEKFVGTFGDFSAFSFQGAKLTVSGEGGVLLTNNEELYHRVYKIYDQGRVPGTFWIDTVGWKYKMSNIQAALAVAQNSRVEAFIDKKRRIHSYYEEFLSQVAGITLLGEVKGTRHIFWLNNLLLNPNCGIARENFFEYLKKNNIDTRPAFPSISQFPFWENRQASGKNSSIISEHGVNLPSGVTLRKNDVKRVCDVISKAIDVLSK